MKKLLLLLAILLVPALVGANDLTINYVDTIVAADTAVQAINVDTLWTSEMDIRGANRYQFHYDIDPLVTHMNLTQDTFYVYFQHSFDRKVWRNWLLGKEIDTVATWATLNASTADSVIGNWARYMVIHRDSTEATAPDSLGFIRGARIRLWIAKIF